jgi:opacity protein-like surface antigen
MRSAALAMTAAAAALLLAGSTAPAAAQNLILQPKVGAYIPASGIGDFQDQTTTIARDRAGSLAIGLGAELTIGALPFNVRGNLEFATGSTVSADDGVTQDVESTLLAVVADVVFRPIPRVLAQPYLLVGAGMKVHEFEVDNLSASERELFPPDQTNLTFHIGAGLDIALGPIGLLIEASDYISRLETTPGGERRLQHDVFVMAGIRVRMF